MLGHPALEQSKHKFISRRHDEHIYIVSIFFIIKQMFAKYCSKAMDNEEHNWHQLGMWPTKI